ncbi:hypothetical protein DUNSADRAFT_10163 [Dunaliella salina]|uniref:Encoded protein n=1 Tax=Dunaliella salina TaxID=3046 RepID=A0ABQ7GFY3_DUNSA|nr:hypothetical protein DUNSADRAFT_10163 [Dunaliella salina]|eukprot:KAF5833512.1 hypothetical protein DUNSADRAFT_10163 [Dunaliella salina]
MHRAINASTSTHIGQPVCIAHCSTTVSMYASPSAMNSTTRHHCSKQHLHGHNSSALLSAVKQPWFGFGNLLSCPLIGWKHTSRSYACSQLGFVFRAAMHAPRYDKFGKPCSALIPNFLLRSASRAVETEPETLPYLHTNY